MNPIQMLVITQLAMLSCSMSIPQVTIDPDVSMPMLGFGTWIGTTEQCSEQEAVEQWLKLGGRHLDLSLSYEYVYNFSKARWSEPEVRMGIKSSGVPREELFLTAKVETLDGYSAAIAQISLLDSLVMDVDYFDLVIIHGPCLLDIDCNRIKNGCTSNGCGSRYKHERLETWRGLEELKRMGKARAIGVSNYNEEHLFELIDAGYKPAVNQVQWHLGYHNDTLLELMNSLGIKMEAWNPLGGATLSTPSVSLSDPRVKLVANRYNASTAQVALQWSIRKGVTPITGSCSKGHMKQDLSALDFSLSTEDIAYLDSLQGQPWTPEPGLTIFM